MIVMLKRIADVLFRLAYGETILNWSNRQYDAGEIYGRAMQESAREELKREWLEKGHARGQAANRTGCPFNLYLTRSDLTAEQEQTAIGVPRSGGQPTYHWWACVNMTNGGEACLGGVNLITTPHQALQAYLELLPDDMRLLCGMPPREVPLSPSPSESAK